MEGRQGSVSAARGPCIARDEISHAPKRAGVSVGMRHPPDVRPGNGTNYHHCDTNGGDPLNRGLKTHETNLAEKVAMLVCSSSIDQGDKRPSPSLGHYLARAR